MLNSQCSAIDLTLSQACTVTENLPLLRVSSATEVVP